MILSFADKDTEDLFVCDAPNMLELGRRRFHKTGIPFQKPDRFPAAFFDNQGYVIVDDEASMRSNPYINVGKQVSIPK